MAGIKDNIKLYVDISERKSVFYSDIEKALNIVKEFIIRKRLILYGGMAIDYALKNKGEPGIYAKDAIPDYDMMSPNFYEDSIELADILYAAGLPNVSSINALHLTSRRVRINFISVADIAYIPPDLYGRIPTYDHEGMRLIHPDFQRLDMHRVFDFPFQNPPYESILERFAKDQKRFKLINDAYPIEKAEASAQMEKREVPIAILNNTCVGGIAVYGLLRNLLMSVKQLIPEDRRKEIDDTFAATTEVQDGKLIVTAPKNYPFNFSTDNFKNAMSRLGSKDVPIYYDKFLEDLRPRTIRVGAMEIFDNKGKLLPCFNLQHIYNFWTKKLGWPQVSGLTNLWISHPQHILLYFLQRAFDGEVEDKTLERELYRSMLKIIELAELAFIADGGDYEDWPFFLSVKTFGQYNWSPTYVVSIKEKKAKIELKTEKLTLRPAFGYYPENKVPATPFDPNQSGLFAIGGAKTTPFEPLEL